MLGSGSRRCLRKSTTRSLLQSLPRYSPLRPPLSRSFHASKPNRLLPEVIGTVSETFHWGLQELHTQTGLPWYLTIPLSASLLRMSWIPIQIWLSRSRKPRETVTQLTKAWRQVYRDMARIKYPFGKEEDAKKADAWVKAQLKIRLKKISQHQSYVRGWVEPVLAISFLPVWILGMDCVKKMAGDTRTITAILVGNTADVGVIEPGFDTESLSWIPTLAGADPTWILPLSFGALSTYSMWTRLRSTIREPISDTGNNVLARGWKTVSYFMLAVPCCFTVIFICGDLPSALALYLLSVTATQIVQRFSMTRLLGTNKRFTAFYAKQAKLKGPK